MRDILGSEFEEDSFAYQLKILRSSLSKICINESDYPLYNGYTVTRCLLSNIMQNRVLQLKTDQILIILDNVIENVSIKKELDNIFRSIDQLYLLETSKVQASHFIEY